MKNIYKNNYDNTFYKEKDNNSFVEIGDWVTLYSVDNEDIVEIRIEEPLSGLAARCLGLQIHDEINYVSETFIVQYIESNSGFMDSNKNRLYDGGQNQNEEIKQVDILISDDAKKGNEVEILDEYMEEYKEKDEHVTDSIDRVSKQNLELNNITKNSPFKKNIWNNTGNVWEDEVIHCPYDMEVLLKSHIRKGKNTKLMMELPIYKCPRCEKEFTISYKFKDLAPVQIGNDTYTNILPFYDILRYGKYKSNSIKSGRNCITHINNSSKNNSIGAEKSEKQIFHCLNDYHELTMIKRIRATHKKYGKNVLFSLYQCPICHAKYTSLKGIADKKPVRLDGIKYINLDPVYENKRYENYIKMPRPLEIVSRCFVYGKRKPFLCRCCRESELIRRTIQYKTKKKKIATYNTEYCKVCDTYYLKSSIYMQHKTDWILLNRDELEKCEEELQLRREEKAKKIYDERLQAELDSKKNPIIKNNEMLHEHDNNIRVKDFVVRRSTFKCRHNDHKLRNIDGVISIIDEKGDIRKTKVPAGYCPNCNIFFIMESTFQNLKKRGTLICRVSDEKAYLSGDSYVNGMKLAQESVLKQYGYSVSKEEGLTDMRRRKILSMLVDSKVLTRNEVISYLDFFINQRKYQNRFENAIEKWENDREYISNYKIGHYTEYGISGINRKH